MAFIALPAKSGRSRIFSLVFGRLHDSSCLAKQEMGFASQCKVFPPSDESYQFCTHMLIGTLGLCLQGGSTF
eukprot:6467875-Amphidinium_carterae.1